VLQFYAVLLNYELRHIHVEQSIQTDLTNKFQRDAAEFMNGKRQVPFAPSYSTAQKGEVLVQKGFILPDRFVEDVADPIHCEDISPRDLNERHVKALVGAAADDEGATRIAVFKDLAGARIIDQSPWTFFLSRNTLTRPEHPGLAVPRPVHALYENENLYFHSYDTTKKFLDLTGIYNEASREDVARFLHEAPVLFQGSGDVYDLADTWTRRRISMMMVDPVWQHITVPEICAVASELESALGPLPFQVRADEHGESLLLPDDRAGLRELVRFLNQDVFRSILTGELFYSGVKIRLNSL
jgi:hypothetical protein